MAKKIREPIPEFDTLEEVAAFWEMHSTADYEDLTQEAQFEICLRDRTDDRRIALLPELSQSIRAIAQARGVSPETLVNVWLAEKVRELA
ncbi:MAG: CopG family antitoxin [Chloroflexota bacterium]